MAAAGSLRLKIECFMDGRKTDCLHSAEPSDLVSDILNASASKLGLNASDWNLCKNEDRTDVLGPSSTLESNGVKSGLKLWLGKVASSAVMVKMRARLNICRSGARNLSLLSMWQIQKDTALSR